MKNFSRARLLLIAGALIAFASCRRAEVTTWQGYCEGEFVYVGAPLAGQLERLAVQRGTQVEAGAPLFTLERSSELAAQWEAGDRLRSAEARLADLRKGSRPSEVAALEARLGQARVSADLSQREFARLNDLFKTGAIAANEFDRARLTHERNLQAVEELGAQLATAKLGARADLVTAAEADVAAAAAAKQRADWAVAQKEQAAPHAAYVHDTLFREGEFVTAGSPIVALLPPENIKLRFFVPEADFARLQAGGRVRATLSGQSRPIEARVTYLSPRPEYTPPVLYNRDNRAKLVFMVEAAVVPAIARELHPGQPIDVALVP